MHYATLIPTFIGSGTVIALALIGYLNKRWPCRPQVSARHSNPIVGHGSIKCVVHNPNSKYEINLKSIRVDGNAGIFIQRGHSAGYTGFDETAFKPEVELEFSVSAEASEEILILLARRSLPIQFISLTIHCNFRINRTKVKVWTIKTTVIPASTQATV